MASSSTQLTRSFCNRPSIEAPPIEAILWFCVSLALGIVGVGAAMLGVGMSYFRGFRARRLPLLCGIVSGAASVALWFLAIWVEPSCSLIFAASTSLGAFMCIAYWMSQYEPK